MAADEQETRWLRVDVRPATPARARSMAAIELVLGLAAVYGGVGLIRDGMGMDVAWIDHTLLPGWEIPGVLLAVVIGGGMLAAAAVSMRRRSLAASAAITMGSVLLGWLAVETLMVGWHGGPQPVLDVVCGGLAVALMVLAAPLLSVSAGAGALRENADRDRRQLHTRFRAGADPRGGSRIDTEHDDRNGIEHSEGVGHHAESS